MSFFPTQHFNKIISHVTETNFLNKILILFNNVQIFTALLTVEKSVHRKTASSTHTPIKYENAHFSTFITE